MPVIARIAKSTDELNDILSLRYQVLTESGQSAGEFTKLTKKLINHLDILPNTLNVIAYQRGKSVGALRATPFSVNEPFHRLGFDFSEGFEKFKGDTYILDMLTLLQAGVIGEAIVKLLSKMILNVLSQRNVENAFFLCPAVLVPMFTDLGFIRLGENFDSDVYRMRVCPMVVSISNYYQKLLQVIVDKEILKFQEVFYLSLFLPGDVLVQQGERGSTAYLIEDGSVDVIVKSNSQLMSLSEIGQGHLIGEVAMLTSEPRTASLVAKTLTTCISFDRSEFIRFIENEPHRSLEVFKIFSKRLNETNKRMAELRNRINILEAKPLE